MSNRVPVGSILGGLAVGALFSNWVIALIVLALGVLAVAVPVLMVCYWTSLASNFGGLDKDEVIALIALPITATLAVWAECRRAARERAEASNDKHQLRP